MGEENKPTEIDSSDSDNCDAQCLKEKPIVARPVVVDAGSSGKGLPYAPEDWPSQGDVWTWRVGKRKSQSGHWIDRSIHPPSHLRNLVNFRSGFHSRISLEQFIQKEYPNEDIDAFFASFSWKVPSVVPDQNEEEGTVIYKSPKPSEVDGCSKTKSSIKPADCQVGNKMCNLGAKTRGFSVVAKSCDICCSETGFCRDCCCILCSKTVDWSYGGYNFIRCEANVDEEFICGHVAHMDCALRAGMAGKVGGVINLDAQYYCRRCDSKTDLTSHVSKLIRTCESLEPQDDIGRILTLGLGILSGSERERPKILENRIASIMAKVSSTNSKTV